jgi:hypothetical protein
MRLTAAHVPLEDLTREGAAPEPEGQREGEDQAAEGDAEGHEHHLLADAQVRDGGRAREKQHAPADGAREQACLRDARVDRRDQRALPEEVRDQPADEEDQRRAHDPRHPGEHELGQAAGARNRERVDRHGEEEDEDAPEDDEPEHLRWRPRHARPAELGDDAPALGAPVEGQRLRHPARDARGDPRADQTHDGQRQHGEDGRRHDDQAHLEVQQSRPYEIGPHVRHDWRLLACTPRPRCLTVSRGNNRRKAAISGRCAPHLVGVTW